MCNVVVCSCGKNSSVSQPEHAHNLELMNCVCVCVCVCVPIYRGLNDIRLISRPVNAPSHELEDTDTNTLLDKVISKRSECYTLIVEYEYISLF